MLDWKLGKKDITFGKIIFLIINPGLHQKTELTNVRMRPINLDCAWETKQCASLSSYPAF